MLSKLHERLNMIEELRVNLNKISKGKSVTDPEVVFASQKLDVAIAEYHKLMKDEKSRS
jgi:hypothetical protein